MKIENLILKAFAYEEGTIVHVEKFLSRHCIIMPRQQLKSKINSLHQKGQLNIHDDPTSGKTNFLQSGEELEEDYWFI